MGWWAVFVRSWMQGHSKASRGPLVWRSPGKAPCPHRITGLLGPSLSALQVSQGKRPPGPPPGAGSHLRCLSWESLARLIRGAGGLWLPESHRTSTGPRNGKYLGFLKPRRANPGRLTQDSAPPPRKRPQDLGLASQRGSTPRPGPAVHPQATLEQVLLTSVPVS